jgi:hypothetical protein
MIKRNPLFTRVCKDKIQRFIRSHKPKKAVFISGNNVIIVEKEVNNLINIYCDESYHLEHDHNDIMVLGCVICERQYVERINFELRQLKVVHGLKVDKENNSTFGTKWVKVSNAKSKYYLNLIDYFFSNEHLSFRCVITTGKMKLDHEAYSQTYDDWYYKIYYCLLKEVIKLKNQYKIYVDKKKKMGGPKVTELMNILNRSLRKFYDETIIGIQIVDSKEIEISQLNDLLLGAVQYSYRGIKTNQAKLDVIDRIVKYSGINLNETT